MKSLVITMLILLFPFCAYSKDGSNRSDFNKLMTAIAENELEQMKSDLTSWVDSETVEALSQIPLGEDDIKQIYQEFRITIVEPPNSDTYTKYSIENAEKSLAKVDQFGRKIQNLLLALPDENFAKYGKLIRLMRDVLYFDWKHIPYAIEHNSARAVYWYELHNKGLNHVEDECKRLFGEKRRAESNR